MSAVATERTTESGETVVDDLDMGGSPESIQADVAEDEVGEDAEASTERDDEGEEPESKEPSREDREAKERIADLESEVARRDEILQALNDRMDRDPAFRKMLEGGSGTDEDDPLSGVQRIIADGLEPDAAKVIWDAVSPLLERVRSLESQLREVTPRVQTLSRSLGTRQFQAGLTGNGVTPAEQTSPEFQRHLKRLRKQGDFQSIESKNPTFAAEIAAAKFRVSRLQTGQWDDERARIRTAKTGKGSGAQQRSSTGAQKVYRVVREGDFIAKAHAIRLKEPDAEIRYIDASEK